ncbi:MAG: aryl-sulfate sulfotransferase, partial [Candidatus Cloacimonetes bacterium]|nr:aryl-sulfate sulfotransferase [Candidatus Cloacimonadota bacterium]
MKNHRFSIRFNLIILIFSISLILSNSYAVEQTIGVIQNTEDALEGYTLFCPSYSYTTYLIDNYGRMVHSWESDYEIDKSCYLLENGNLLRTFRTESTLSGIQEFTWDGVVIWEYIYSSNNYSRHHDIEPLPNGNVLILVRQDKTEVEAHQAGRDPSLLTTNILFTEFIVEVSPTGLNTADIIWEWHLWDHLIQDFDPAVDNYGVVEEHPELVDINFLYNTTRDWIHGNSVDYNQEFDQIILSSRNLSEIWVLDHTTTTEEAAGHTGGIFGAGGDLLYRWGNPQAYRAGDEIDRKYFGQHDARWVENGLPGADNILVFNNGEGRPDGDYSTVDEIIPPVDFNGFYTQPPAGSAFLPETQEWIYSGNGSNPFYSRTIAGAHRLFNGNTMICIGRSGHFIEVTSTDEIVWEYINPITNEGVLNQGDPPPTGGNATFRCHKYSLDYGVLPEQELLPGNYLEINPVTFYRTTNFPTYPTLQDTVIVTSKVMDESGINSVNLITFIEGDSLLIQMFDDGLNEDEIAGDSIYTAVISPQDANIVVSYYLSAEDGSGDPFTDPPFASSTYGFHYIINTTGTIGFEIPNSNCSLTNFPNPFNPTTTIAFSILEESNVELSIYNIKGQKIKSLLSDQIEAGEHSIIW